MLFSIIIPVYNRPDEVKELLESLTKQTDKKFEVIVVEDGSTHTCEAICKQYAGELDIKYLFKENSGPGGSRITVPNKPKVIICSYLTLTASFLNTIFKTYVKSSTLIPAMHSEVLMLHMKISVTCKKL